MRAIRTFVSGLLLSTLCLLPVSISAAEAQPFFTLKTSSVNTLIGVAEKIGDMAGFANDAQLRDAVRAIRDIKGFDFDNIIGIAAAVGDDGSISPILLLPITDLWKAEIPSMPQIFDMIRPFLTKKGENTEINSPFGTFVVVQKQGYLVVVAENFADQLPSDPRKLFADLEKYTLGVKFDFDKVDFETLEANLFGPLAFLAMMQNPEMGEQLEDVFGFFRELYQEFSVLSGGIAFNPQNADFEISATAVPRKGSGAAKFLADCKQQPTIFNGFRGTPGNVIFSFGSSLTYPPLPLPNPLTTQLETVFDGIMEQVEMEDESGDLSAAVREIGGLIQRVLEAEMKRGACDFALSFDTSGTFLCAFDTVSLGEFQDFAAMAVDYLSYRIPSDLASDLAYDLRQDYLDIGGFQVSGTVVPVGRTLEMVVSSPPPVLDNLSLAVLWAVKDTSGKQAIAFAIGPDFASTEQKFKSALEKTKTPAPVLMPQGTLSVQELGKFLRLIEDNLGSAPEEIKKVIDTLASAGDDATISLSFDLKPARAEGGFRISGKAMMAVFSLVRMIAPTPNL